MDANTQLLNRYLSGEEQLALIQHSLELAIKPQLTDIRTSIEYIRSLATDYHGYDLTEFTDHLIKDQL